MSPRGTTSVCSSSCSDESMLPIALTEVTEPLHLCSRVLGSEVGVEPHERRVLRSAGAGGARCFKAGLDLVIRRGFGEWRAGILRAKRGKTGKWATRMTRPRL